MFVMLGYQGKVANTNLQNMKDNMARKVVDIMEPTNINSPKNITKVLRVAFIISHWNINTET